jgi:hypothetical protein
MRERLRAMREHESVAMAPVNDDRAAPEWETAIAPGGKRDGATQRKADGSEKEGSQEEDGEKGET